jgi:hypothetical protein
MTMGNESNWWQDLEPIHKDEGDGQYMAWTYARKVRSSINGKGQWEYAIVTMTDDGTPVKAIVLSGGKVREVEL